MKKNNRILFHGNIIVAFSFYIMALAWGANRTFAVFLGPMLSEFGWTRASISSAFTVAMIITGFMGIYTGKLTDRFGPRIVVISSAIFLGVGYYLISIVENIWQFYLFYGILTGIGLSGFTVPLMSLVSRWFVKRRALMTGIVTAGPSFGIVVLPLAFSSLITAHGWRTSNIILSIIIIVLLIPGAMVLRREPNEIGLLPFGAEKMNFDGLEDPVEGYSFSKAVQTKKLWLLNILFFCDLFLMNVITVHIVIHAVGLGILPIAAASILSVAGGVSIFARIIVGGIADRIGYILMFIICLILALISFSLLLIAKRLWLFYLFATIFGFGVWSSPSLIAPITAELFGLRSHGAIFGLLFCSGSIGGAFGPLLIGHVFDVTGSYQLGFLICILLIIMGLIILLFLRSIAKKEFYLEGEFS